MTDTRRMSVVPNVPAVHDAEFASFRVPPNPSVQCTTEGSLVKLSDELSKKLSESKPRVGKCE
jgi:hypothetical protein